MRVARVQVSSRRSTAVIKRRAAHLVSGNVLGAQTPAGETAPPSTVEFPVPMRPAKFLAIRIDDRSRAHGDAIVLAADWTNVHIEAAVVAVIGTHIKHVSENDMAGAGARSDPVVRAQ